MAEYAQAKVREDTYMQMDEEHSIKCESQDSFFFIMSKIHSENNVRLRHKARGRNKGEAFILFSMIVSFVMWHSCSSHIGRKRQFAYHQFSHHLSPPIPEPGIFIQNQGRLVDIIRHKCRWVG